jgi:Family of unknown function (DUF5681)
MALKMRTNSGQWQKGISGNPAGRPRGSPNQSKSLLEVLGPEARELVAHQVFEMALDGHSKAIKMFIERFYPAPKHGPIDVDLPALETSQDLYPAIGEVDQARFGGRISRQQATVVKDLLRAEGHHFATQEWHSSPAYKQMVLEKIAEAQRIIDRHGIPRQPIPINPRDYPGAKQGIGGSHSERPESLPDSIPESD